MMRRIFAATLMFAQPFQGGGPCAAMGAPVAAAAAMGAGAAMMYSFSLSQGGVELNARFDPSARKLWFRDKEIALNDANVVLVDAVDSPAGPHVVRTLRVDPEYETTVEPPPYELGGRGPQMRARPVPVQTFIRRSPELIEFLQCDAPLAGLKPYEQQMFDAMCAHVRQP